MRKRLITHYSELNKKCQSQGESDMLGGGRFRCAGSFWWDGAESGNLNLIDRKTNHTQKSINFIHSTYTFTFIIADEKILYIEKAC